MGTMFTRDTDVEIHKLTTKVQYLLRKLQVWTLGYSYPFNTSDYECTSFRGSAGTPWSVRQLTNGCLCYRFHPVYYNELCNRIAHTKHKGVKTETMHSHAVIQQDWQSAHCISSEKLQNQSGKGSGLRFSHYRIN